MFYGWWLVGAGALITAVGIAPMFHGMTAWFPVLESRFGWSRTQLSVAFALTRVEGSITGPLGGWLVDKLGPQRMVLIGLPILGIGFVLLSMIQNLWQFYGAFMVMSVGMGLGTWIPVSTLLNSWFIRRRATAMALAFEGLALGGILVVPALAWSIDPDRFGPDRWRAAAFVIGLALILVAWPISRAIRNKPEDYGLRPDGDPSPAVGVGISPKATPVGTAESGWTWQEAIRTRTFWLISIGHACSSIVIVTVTVHLGAILNLDRGLPLQTVGWIVATYTAVGAIFTLVGGYVGDRVPTRLALFAFSAIQSASVVILLVTESTSVAFLFAVILGIGFGGRNPLTLSIRGVYFGRRAFGSILGISTIPMNILVLAAPLFAGYMFDTRGSYDIGFITVAVVSFAGACLFLFLGEPQPASCTPRPPRRTGT